MRSVLVWGLLSSLSTRVLAVSQLQENTAEIVAQNVDKIAESAAAAAGEDDGIEYTIFDNIRVPQMKDIEGEKFNETIKEGYW